MDFIIIIFMAIILWIADLVWKIKKQLDRIEAKVTPKDYYYD